MKSLLANLPAIGLTILVCFALYSLFPKKEIVYKDKLVQVHLGQTELDSLNLSFEVRLKAAAKPARLITVKDTASANFWLREYLKAKGELNGLAVAPIEYHGQIGRYNDSLNVIADCINDSLFVGFKPNDRDFTVVFHDTVSVGDGFWTDLKQVGGGFLVGLSAAELAHAILK